jgi:hypothetical protein
MGFRMGPPTLDRQSIEDRTARPLLDQLRAIRELASSAIEGEFSDHEALQEIERISMRAVGRRR